jgi:hypothetical protein
MVIVVCFYRMKKEATILNQACRHSPDKWATSSKVFKSERSAAVLLRQPGPTPGASKPVGALICGKMNFC